jgi:hypothetical protein
MAMPEFHSRGTQWWLSFALFAAIVLALVIAALTLDPLSAAVP